MTSESNTPRAIATYLESRFGEMLAFLKTLVESESPTDNKAAVDRFGQLLQDFMRENGGRVELIRQEAAGNNLKVTWDLCDPRSQRTHDAQILVLCHMDTVWPVGEIATRPFRIDGDRAFGPGVIDMKAGILVGFYAIKALQALGLPTKLPIVFVFNSDEETQSHHSRDLIESESAKSRYVLCLEPRVPPGKVPTSRKSVTTLTMHITGKASHAGAAPEKGVSAILELAHQTIALHALADLSKGTTVTVGVVSGGTRPNVIPGTATALIDIRASSPEEDARIKEAIERIGPITPGAIVTTGGGQERPLWAHKCATETLFQRIAPVALQLGLAFEPIVSGGVTDANFAGALGIPTADGLGPDGDGCHQVDEYLELHSLVPSTVLLAELLRTLD